MREGRLLDSLQHTAAEHKGEEQLVLGKDGPAHVAVEVVGEVLSQVAETLFQVLGFGAKGRGSGRGSGRVSGRQYWTTMMNTLVRCPVLQGLLGPHLSLMELMKRLTNHAREYWYIGSMLAMSEVQKNRTDPWAATGR